MCTRTSIFRELTSGLDRGSARVHRESYKRKAMATTAPPNVGGGTITGVKTDNATNQLQKKRRNRSKKKRGKGGVVGVGDGGGGGAAAQGSPTADAGFATRQKQKQKNPPPTEQRQKKHLQQQQQPQPRQRDRGQQHRNKKDNPRTAVQRPTQASLTGPPQPNVQPSTAVTGFKRAPAPVFDIIDPKGAGGQHHEVAMDTSNVGDASRFGQVSPSSSVTTGTSTPRFKKCTETGEAADRSIRHDNLVTSKGAPVTNEIAPFECSWTAVLNADDKVDGGKSPKHGGTCKNDANKGNQYHCPPSTLNTNLRSAAVGY